MSQEEFEEKLQQFFGVQVEERPFVIGLSEALHSFNECELWPDNVDSVSCEQCWWCWKIIHVLMKQKDFPTELKM